LQIVAAGGAKLQMEEGNLKLPSSACGELELANVAEPGCPFDADPANVPFGACWTRIMPDQVT
jgi:hypothetical protein